MWRVSVRSRPSVFSQRFECTISQEERTISDAMAALHEFREAMEDPNSNIRNKGGYMMGVLRKYLPGEAASGVTYDGTAVSELEKSMMDTETFADPWKQITENDAQAKAAAAAQEREERERVANEAKLRKSPPLPSDALHVKRFIKKKIKEAGGAILMTA